MFVLSDTHESTSRWGLHSIQCCFTWLFWMMFTITINWWWIQSHYRIETPGRPRKTGENPMVRDSSAWESKIQHIKDVRELTFVLKNYYRSFKWKKNKYKRDLSTYILHCKSTMTPFRTQLTLWTKTTFRKPKIWPLSKGNLYSDGDLFLNYCTLLKNVPLFKGEPLFGSGI